MVLDVSQDILISSLSGHLGLKLRDQQHDCCNSSLPPPLLRRRIGHCLTSAQTFGVKTLIPFLDWDNMPRAVYPQPPAMKAASPTTARQTQHPARLGMAKMSASALWFIGDTVPQRPGSISPLAACPFPQDNANLFWDDNE